MPLGVYESRSPAGTVLNAGARVERLGTDSDAHWVETKQKLQARSDGFDLYGGVTVAGDDRDRLEQLCRYLLRPPIAQERLALLPDGKVLDAKRLRSLEDENRRLRRWSPTSRWTPRC